MVENLDESKPLIGLEENFGGLKSEEASFIDHYSYISGDLNDLVPNFLQKCFLESGKRTKIFYGGLLLI